ncbi:hypothetical protein BSNK01_03470 [Bacillaceae bacterium]
MKYEELSPEIQNLCRSKAEEFALLGYGRVKGEDVWNCVCAGYKDGLPRLHRLVNDILSLKTTKFMNWLMLNAYKGTMAEE